MRIGIDARLNAYREGGIAEYTRRLVWEFAASPTQYPNQQYHLFGHWRASAPLLPAEAPHFRTHRAWTPPHHVLEALAFGAEVAPRRIDVLHSPDFIPPAFGARRYVITVHDLSFLHFPHFQTADSLRYYSGQIGRAVRQAAHILADSGATKDDLCDLLGVPPEKITVHMLGVDSQFRPLEDAETRAALGAYQLSPGYFLCVGTFEPRKNLPGLFAAYAQLRADLGAETPPLVVVGRRGWLYEPAFAAAEALSLGAALRWLEDVPMSALPALYNGAAALVTPSFYEGFGFPALEAMACGVPTIVSNRGSLPEVVGDTGLLVDPDSVESIAAGLHRALTDSEFRSQSRAAGLARARHFTWRHTADIVRGVYQQVGG